MFLGGWTLFGFWYTVSANGAVWGIIMGTALIIENHLLKKKIMDFTGIFYTFLVVIFGTVFFFGDDLGYSVKYLFAMVGGNGEIADVQAFYLLKSYVVLLLVTMYAATDLFRNMMMRSGKSKVRIAVAAASPLIAVAVLLLCTSLISYSGSSDMLLIRL